MAFAQLTGVQLFYTDDGAGNPPMLFVHGFACDSHDWSWQLAHFAASHRVIAADLRGHGRSSVPPSGYDPQQFASDLAALLEVPGTGPVVAVGHSLGATIVSTLAFEHPEMVQALVVVDPAYLTPDEVRAAVGDMHAFLEHDPIGATKAVLGSLYTASSPPALRTWHQRRIEGVPPHVLVETITSLQRSNTFTYTSESLRFLAKRELPVLSIWADANRAALEASTFRDQRSKAVAHPGSGHWVHQEHPTEVNDAIDGWLYSLAGDDVER